MSWTEGTEVVIDQIEQEIVVIEFEDGSMGQCSMEEMPEGVKEGYVLRFQNGAWQIDMEAYAKRKAEIEELFSDFFS